MYILLCRATASYTWDCAAALDCFGILRTSTALRRASGVHRNDLQQPTDLATMMSSSITSRTAAMMQPAVLVARPCRRAPVRAVQVAASSSRSASPTPFDNAAQAPAPRPKQQPPASWVRRVPVTPPSPEPPTTPEPTRQQQQQPGPRTVKAKQQVPASWRRVPPVRLDAPIDVEVTSS